MRYLSTLPFFYFCLSLLIFFLYLIPIFTPSPSPFDITTITSAIANCQCQPWSLQQPSFSSFSCLFLSLYDLAQWCWSTFRYIFLLIFIWFFIYSFSTYLFYPNYLLFYRYLFRNVGLLFIFLSFLVLLFIVWMNNL